MLTLILCLCLIEKITFMRTFPRAIRSLSIPVLLYGKSIHDQHPEKSYIDLNRSGVALMEIVSEPEIRRAEEAAAYVRKLRAIVRCLGTCDGNMDQGSMRVDVNVSVRKAGAPFGTRAEIKNVNSIKFLAQAIDYEAERQVAILEEGG